MTVSYEVLDRIGLAIIDNGKANVLSPDVIGALDAALTEAEQAGPESVGALVIAGKPGFLSGGFDLSIMMSSGKAAGELVTAGGAFFARCFASALPVIGACTGHAVAAGALLLLACDERVGAEGEFKIGLIETAKGMVLPRWAIELAEERLSRRHFQVATVGARMYPPAQARDAGFLDEVVAPDQVVERALAMARDWAALPHAAYAGQVQANRGARIDRLNAAVAADRGATFALP
jgi:enoyl-CoA hydratase